MRKLTPSVEGSVSPRTFRQWIDIVEGVNDHFLYHATFLDDAVIILNADQIEARTKHDSITIAGFRPRYADRSGFLPGVSLTRNLAFAREWKNPSVIFKLNAAKLRLRHHLELINYHGDRREAEEFLVGPIAPLSVYLMSIQISRKVYSICKTKARRGKSRQLYANLLNDPKLEIY